jgi:hypothetical protein
MDRDDAQQAVQQEQEPKEEKQEKAVALRLPVRRIAEKDGSSLVEWIGEDGLYHRAYVPNKALDKGTVSTKDLQKGIPYGLPWEQWVEIQATPERIANELRRMGVWCLADLNHIVLTAVNKAFDQGEFIKLVNQEAKQ